MLLSATWNWTNQGKFKGNISKQVIGSGHMSGTIATSEGGGTRLGVKMRNRCEMHRIGTDLTSTSSASLTRNANAEAAASTGFCLGWNKTS
jgi:hypothetical protein